MIQKYLTALLITAMLAATPIQAAADTVGAIMPTKEIPYYDTVHETIVKELGAMGSGVEVLLQKPAPQIMAWKNATRKLVTLESKVIIAYGTATALAITRENHDIPVVYCGAYDPAGAGVAGNSTGMSGTVPLKGLIGNLKKIANFKKLAILYSQQEPETVKQMETATDLAGKLGAEVIKIDTGTTGEIPDFQGADAVFLTSAAQINSENNLKQIVEQARASKTATAAILSGTCELGVVFSLSANPEHQGKGAAMMVAEILKGKKPADIPVNNSPKVEMTINLKEAKSLGLNIPFELLGTAKVIK